MTRIIADKTEGRLCPFGLAPSIPPTAVGGCLRSSLQAAATLFNPPNGSWGMVKVRPSRPLEQSHLAARRLDFNHPPTAVGGIEERENASDVGRTLTIPQLLLGGLKNDPQKYGVCLLC